MTVNVMREPVLTGLVTALRAPSAVVSEQSGDLRRRTAQGFYHQDRRFLSHLSLSIDGERPVRTGLLLRADEAVFQLVVPHVNYLPMEGPSLHVIRQRKVHGDAFTEAIVLHNQSPDQARVRLTIEVEADLAPISTVRSGDQPPALEPTESRSDRISWGDARCGTHMSWSRGPDGLSSSKGTVEVYWTVALDGGGIWSMRVAAQPKLKVDNSNLDLKSGSGEGLISIPQVKGRSRPRANLLETSAADLDSLILRELRQPEHVFPAAGSPWYFSLFGRDAIWTSRLIVPIAPELARGTLLALVNRQGHKIDSASEEEPGKVAHEVRQTPTQILGVLDLPATYFGTIDATALWILLLHDLWMFEGDDSLLTSQRHALRLALDWITDFGDMDGDGFIEYQRRSDRGLANQAWKDSPTGIRYANGIVPEGPIAPCEVQAYAYEAVMSGVRMLAAAGSEVGPSKWVSWAGILRSKFHEHFWLEDDLGPYPAIALDGQKNPITGASSNIGHLLGTGIVDPEEAALISKRLAQPDLDGGYGLRTLSDRVRSYSSLSYHRGSVWPHDTAIAIRGLALEGYRDLARRFANELVQAAERFAWRLPELYGGNSRDGDLPLTAYPTACAPQAWASAAGIVAVGVLEGWLIDGWLTSRPSNPG